MYSYYGGIYRDKVRGDDKSSKDASSGKSFKGVNYCGVVFINGRERGEARVAYRDIEYYAEAVDSRERGGKEG